MKTTQSMGPTPLTNRSRRIGAAVVLAIVLAIASRVTAEEAGSSASRGAGAANDAELEVLRRLLGLPAEPVDGSAASPSEPAASPASIEGAGGEADEVPASERPAASSHSPHSGRRPAPATAAKAAPRTAAKSARRFSTSSTLPGEPRETGTTQPAGADQQATGTAAAAQGDDDFRTIPFTPTEEIPPPGTVVNAQNVEHWKHLLGPSVQWSVEHGATIDVVEHKAIPLEKVRADATQRYSAQVRLSDDKRSIKNFVAGIPFPFVNEDDPDAAPKLMFNMENRINQDDLDARNFSCDTGTLDGPDGFTIQRHYQIDHFRRFYHVGRLWVDPKPEYPGNEDRVRYREMLYPIVEPFDLKGSGFTYMRFLDPNRQDDSWLYFPQQRRVRRLSTAQRSEGVFGQDVDLDSYGGFAGNPAWTTWTFLGKKTILASMHARNSPARFEKAPAAYFPDDVWEPREVWVILGISQLGGYNFGRRVIYLDRESWIIPYTEIYDRNGSLWRTLIHTWNSSKTPVPNAKRSVYEDDTTFVNAFTLIDMQLSHATRCQFPSADAKGEEAWYYRFGSAEGTTPEQFSVSNFIATGR